MAIINIGNYYAEWSPSGSVHTPGEGRIMMRNALKLTDLHYLNGLHAQDYRMLLHMLQTEKPVFWDTETGKLRTAHPQTHDAETVGNQERH